jgi:hypothetical protein
MISRKVVGDFIRDRVEFAGCDYQGDSFETPRVISAERYVKK